MKEALTVAVFLIGAVTTAGSREFGGYECTDDCSGHKAGYEWAQARGLKSATACETLLMRWPNRNSFYEGCLTYLAEPYRGAEEDDDGDDID